MLDVPRRRAAQQQAPGIDGQGVCAVGTAGAPPRRGAAPLVDCLSGLGHELRWRLERYRCGHPATARPKVDDGFEPKLIQTVRGMGYMLDLPMQGDRGKRHPWSLARRITLVVSVTIGALFAVSAWLVSRSIDDHFRSAGLRRAAGGGRIAAPSPRQRAGGDIPDGHRHDLGHAVGRPPWHSLCGLRRRWAADLHARAPAALLDATRFAAPAASLDRGAVQHVGRPQETPTAAPSSRCMASGSSSPFQQNRTNTICRTCAMRCGRVRSSRPCCRCSLRYWRCDGAMHRYGASAPQ